MASVTLSDIRKSYGDVEVIHGIDLDVQDGEFVALVGPSGCGKSTLLRMIAGLDHPTTGDIAIAGTRVNTFTPKERNIAMVFQNYALYPHMTVDQNISFNLRLSGLPKDEIKRRVDEAARMLDLTGLLDRRPSQLSGGQRQRVAMGRAVVRDPAVFLFDEPLSNLDAKLRVQMRGEIKVLHEKVGTTAIYVTHDQIEAMTLADRIVVLNKGRVEQQGSPLELYRRPQNMFVAGFIGSPAMNFIPCTLAHPNSGTELVFEGGERLRLSGRFGVSGQNVVLGARPEHFQLSPSTPGALNGTVRLLEPTGAQMHLVVEAMGQALTVVIDGDSVITAGEAVGLAIAEERIHLFDAQTSLRVNQHR